MKSKQLIQEMRTMDSAGLKEKARVLSEELMKLNFRLASRQVEQAHVIRSTRRNRARALTVLTEKRAAAKVSAGNK